jgi:Na+/phosphate symporter
MGILSMLTTATIYLPAMLLGALVLRNGWLAGVRFGSPRALTSVLDLIYDPITQAARASLPDLAVFAIGFVGLLAAFQVFDRALPQVGSSVVETRWGRWFDQPWTTFLLGLLVTSITLSVSVSLSVLVPLASRGYVRRDQVIPYIMGANISTFVDTLFASLLIRTPLAFTIVLTEMGAVAAVSLLVLVAFFQRYRGALMGLNSFFAASRWRFTLFVAILAIVPLTLLLL